MPRYDLEGNRLGLDGNIERSESWGCMNCGMTWPTTFAPTFSALTQCGRAISRGYWCESCTFTCIDCDAQYVHWRFQGEIGHAWGERCARCAQEYRECYHCDDALRRGDVNEVDGMGVCDSCLEENYRYCDTCEEWENRESRCAALSPIQGMYAYHDRPRLRFLLGKGEVRKPDTLFLGWELEIEASGSDTPRDAFPCEPWAWKSEDGSLDFGVEYVAHPMTYEWVQENRAEIAAWLKAVRAEGGRSYDTSTCGMHVHLSRVSFSSLHLYKFMRLFYESPAFVLAMSQRKPELLRRWASVEDPDGKRAILRKAKEKFSNGSQGRYAAINLENDRTIEVRIFRGSLREASFFKNLEFVHAAWAYTREASMASSTASKFAAWVGANVKMYPHLAAFLQLERVMKTYA